MKRKLALLLALVTMSAFTACGDTAEENSSSESSVSESSDEESSEKEESKEEESSEEKSEEEESSEEESSEETEEETTNNALIDAIVSNIDGAIEGYEMGTVENGVYSSAFNHLKFTAPEGFDFSTEDEILAMMNIGADIVAGDRAELYKAVSAQTSFYDMVAQNAATGESVMVLYENIAAYGIDVSSYTVDDYIEAVEQQFELAAQSGIVYEKTGEMSEAVLGNDTFSKITYSCDVSGYYTLSQTYYLTIRDGYMLGVIVSPGFTENDASYYESCFTAYAAE